jgi:hypothetical protein
MPIPTAFDAKIAEVDATAQSVIVTLSTMSRANERDRAAMRMRLRERLEQFVTLVMDTAP